MKLAILGNGFDLHHGLNTSFNEFRNYLIKNEEENFVNIIDNIINNYNNTSDLSNIYWNNVEVCFYEEFRKFNNIVKKEERKSKLNDLEYIVSEFTSKLYNYLVLISENVTISINPNIKVEMSNLDILLTFNYTSIYTEYEIDSNTEIFHIHGELSEGNLPLIGFYSTGTSRNTSTQDYKKKYGGRFLHKPALAMKQNAIDFDVNIKKFQDKYKSKIDEVVVIGFSFGGSDEHIYSLLNSLLIIQETEENMYYQNVDNMPKIIIKFFSYNDEESDLIIKRIRDKMKMYSDRRFSVYKTGNSSFHSEKEDIIVFEVIPYQ